MAYSTKFKSAISETGGLKQSRLIGKKPHMISSIDELTEKDEIPSLAAYAEDGVLLDNPENGYCCEATFADGQSNYYVKFGMYGIDSGHLYDPWNPNAPILQTNISESLSGRKLYDWRRVTKETFDLYFRFLKTRNHAYLRQAERLALLDNQK
jgi:hypothetical protein